MIQIDGLEIITNCPEVKLWQSVVCTLIDDFAVAIRRVTRETGKHGMPTLDALIGVVNLKREAKGRDFADVCGFAGVHPDDVGRVMIRLEKYGGYLSHERHSKRRGK